MKLISAIAPVFLLVDENDLEPLSHEVKMDYSDYVNQTKKALTRINLGSLNFVYQAKKQKDGSLMLSWKKHMMAENIKVIHALLCDVCVAYLVNDPEMHSSACQSCVLLDELLN